MNSLCICKSRLLFTYPTVKNPNKVITSDLSLVADFYSLLKEFSNIKPMFASCLQCKQSRFLALYLTWTLFSSLHTFSPSLLKVIFCSDSFHKVVIFVIVVFFLYFNETVYVRGWVRYPMSFKGELLSNSCSMSLILLREL